MWYFFIQHLLPSLTAGGTEASKSQDNIPFIPQMLALQTQAHVCLQMKPTLVSAKFSPAFCDTVMALQLSV